MDNNKSERLIYTIMFAGGNSSIEKALNDQCFFLVLKWKPFQMKIEVWYNRRKYKCLFGGEFLSLLWG